MKTIYLSALLLLTSCTKTGLWFEHQEGQHYMIAMKSYIRTTRPGSWCKDSIYKRERDTLYWNIENPDVSGILNQYTLDSTRLPFYYISNVDSVITQGTTYGKLK